LEGRIDALSLYAEQLGFLHAHRETPQVGGKGTKREAKSRLQLYLDHGAPPPLPTVTVGAYLIEAMNRLGPVRAHGMGGCRPTDWPEIWAYAQATGDVSEAWEIDAIRRLCVAYDRGLSDGANMLAIAPMDR